MFRWQSLPSCNRFFVSQRRVERFFNISFHRPAPIFALSISKPFRVSPLLLLICLIVSQNRSVLATNPPVAAPSLSRTNSFVPQDHRQSLPASKNPSKMQMDSNPQTSSEELDKVCIIGSGNWGSAISVMVGRNCQRLDHFETKVNMWVYEEMIELPDGSSKKLTEVINEKHENVKYLPGVTLPENVVAVPDLTEACRGATLLIFVLPHQFLPRLLPTIRAAVRDNCRGVSLIKGLGK